MRRVSLEILETWCMFDLSRTLLESSNFSLLKILKAYLSLFCLFRVPQ
jgi:hypothetical protein